MAESKPQTEQADHKPHQQAAERLFSERNNYFTGKYMTARDFRDEQDYLRSHHNWHQWTLHGWGIVWGLQVEHRDHCITISPGMALDCRGRELVLPYPVRFSIAELLSHHPHSSHPDKPDASVHDFLLGLRFSEVEREQVPLILDDGCSPTKRTHNRIEEFARIWWEKYSDGNASDMKCWSFPPLHLPIQTPNPSEFQPWNKSRASEPGHVFTLHEHNAGGDCGCPQAAAQMIPPCECGSCGFVPLARIKKIGDAWHEDDRGCRYVRSPFYGEALTHVVGINWNHGAETKYEDFIQHYEPLRPSDLQHDYAQKIHAKCRGKLGRIVIKFDRQLSLPDYCQHSPEATTSYFRQLLKLDFVRAIADDEGFDLDGDDKAGVITPESVRLWDHGRSLHCDFQTPRIKNNLPVAIRLSLNCDFLLDVRGRAVDGEHIGGQVPNINTPDRHGRSGDGIEGGTFYTWTIVPAPR